MGLSKNHYQFGFCSFIKRKLNNSELSWTFERSGWLKGGSSFYNYSWKFKDIQLYFDVTLCKCGGKRAIIWNSSFCNRFKSLSKINNCKKFWIDGDYNWSIATYDKPIKVNKIGSFNFEQHIECNEWKDFDKGIRIRVGDNWIFRWFFGRYCSEYFGWYFFALILIEFIYFHNYLINTK